MESKALLEKEEACKVVINVITKTANIFEDICPDTYERAQAMVKLEEAAMWANTSISRRKEEKQNGKV